MVSVEILLFQVIQTPADFRIRKKHERILSLPLSILVMRQLFTEGTVYVSHKMLLTITTGLALLSYVMILKFPAQTVMSLGKS
jgi:hypothetical protein